MIFVGQLLSAQITRFVKDKTSEQLKEQA